jgi:hypothetical protein
MWQHAVTHLGLGSTVLESEEIYEVASGRASHIHTDFQQTFGHREHKGKAVLPPCVTMFVITHTIGQQCNSYIKGDTLMLIWIIKEKSKSARTKLLVRARTRWSTKNGRSGQSSTNDHKPFSPLTHVPKRRPLSAIFSHMLPVYMFLSCAYRWNSGGFRKLHFYGKNFCSH